MLCLHSLSALLHGSAYPDPRPSPPHAHFTKSAARWAEQRIHVPCESGEMKKQVQCKSQGRRGKQHASRIALPESGPHRADLWAQGPSAFVGLRWAETRHYPHGDDLWRLTPMWPLPGLDTPGSLGGQPGLTQTPSSAGGRPGCISLSQLDLRQEFRVRSPHVRRPL